MKKRTKISIIMASIIVLVGFKMLSSVVFLGLGPSRATADDFSLTIYVREENRIVSRGGTVEIEVTLRNNTWRAQRTSYGVLFYPYIPGVFEGRTLVSPWVRIRMPRNGIIQETIPLRISNSAILGKHDLSVETRFAINARGGGVIQQPVSDFIRQILPDNRRMIIINSMTIEIEIK
ncbi:MAG: hypothetical protein FWE45_03285 [Firmicutes bacterium]|nr:hypothetical protein [Bacillota bacterium]